MYKKIKKYKLGIKVHYIKNKYNQKKSYRKLLQYDIDYCYFNKRYQLNPNKGCKCKNKQRVISSILGCPKQSICNHDKYSCIQNNCTYTSHYTSRIIEHVRICKYNKNRIKF
jgi:hypothetical protein